MIYILSILSFFLLISIVISIALYIGSQRALSRIEYYEDFIYTRRKAYENLLLRIRTLDAKEMFEKDDEVGIIFGEIKTEIEEFSKLIEE